MNLLGGLVSKASSPSRFRACTVSLGPGRASVFVVDADRAKRREVRVAFIESSGVALSEGLKPGEQVVTDGALYLQDNDEIAIAKESAPLACGTCGNQ